MQGKVLTYMSYGLPVISSEKVSQNFGLSVLSFKNNSDLIKKINDLKKNKVLSNRLSKKSLQLSKQLIWSKVSRKYYKLLDFNKYSFLKQDLVTGLEGRIDFGFLIKVFF